jgi:hypothetical protein
MAVTINILYFFIAFVLLYLCTFVLLYLRGGLYKSLELEACKPVDGCKVMDELIRGVLFERTRRRKIAKQFSDGAGVSL